MITTVAPTARQGMSHERPSLSLSPLGVALRLRGQDEGVQRMRDLSTRALHGSAPQWGFRMVEALEESVAAFVAQADKKAFARARPPAFISQAFANKVMSR